MVLRSACSIPHSDKIQHSAIAEALFVWLPHPVSRIVGPSANAKVIVLGVRLPHSFEAVLAFFEVCPERAEHAPRALASRAVQWLFDERRRIIIFPVARHDVAVYAARSSRAAYAMPKYACLFPARSGCPSVFRSRAVTRLQVRRTPSPISQAILTSGNTFPFPIKQWCFVARQYPPQRTTVTGLSSCANRGGDGLIPFL